jgi:signal transduction histidine kinase
MYVALVVFGAALGLRSLLREFPGPVNGLPLSEMSASQWAALVNGIVYYVSAGAASGLVTRVLQRSARERALAFEDAARERERAARMAEREELGREIHDSVLQALALVGKRGRELSQHASVPGEEVSELLDLAARQEQALRNLLSEPAEVPPPGSTSLRTTLQAAAFDVRGVPVAVSTAGAAWLPTVEAEVLGAAVRQALDNVTRHANARHATVFAEEVDGEVVVSVRDDGIGFRYDEERLAAQGRFGLLRSMKGRVEEIGGWMVVHAAPGSGTEIEFHVPVPAAVEASP